ncbi:MAG TPA: GNAT family N-acetyltransferase [Micrococcaceae bacterium]
MSGTVTLIARTAPLERELRMSSRIATAEDTARLGELYFSAYDPGAGSENPQSADADVRAYLSGQFGTYLPEASPVALNDDGEIIAAVMVVERATYEDTPDAPFILELFTDRDHRRRGLAEQLVLASMDALFNAGYKEVALQVDETNSAALALYLSLDFRRWSPDADDLAD